MLRVGVACCDGKFLHAVVVFVVVCYELHPSLSLELLIIPNSFRHKVETVSIISGMTRQRERGWMDGRMEYA